MNAALIDTNILIECFQHNQSISEAISQFDRILICPAVLGEFKAGIDVNTRRGKRSRRYLTSSWTIQQLPSSPVPTKQRITTPASSGR